jgi:hypothetical protein
MVKLSKKSLKEKNQLKGRDNALAKLKKKSTRNMSLANQRKAENENLAVLFEKFPFFYIASSTITNSFGKFLYFFSKFYSIY